MADKVLAKLYAANPDARKEIEPASGYGVFDIPSINAVLLVGAKGPGVIFDNKTKKPTFMTSIRAGTGPGVGYQALFQIFVAQAGKNAAHRDDHDEGVRQSVVAYVMSVVPVSPKQPH